MQTLGLPPGGGHTAPGRASATVRQQLLMDR